MNPFKIFLATLFIFVKPYKTLNTEPFYDIKLKSLNGQTINLKDYEGKYILFVNVASKCGFTPQYKALQELYELYKDKLQVIGVPCNQFGGQEPGSSADIEAFCEVNYGVSFLMTEKIDVKGKNQHNLYEWLTNKTRNKVSDSQVKWNFQKYLVNDKGEFVDYFYSATSPLDKKITKHLN